MDYCVAMLDTNKSVNSEAFLVKTVNFNYIIDTGYKKGVKDLIKLDNEISNLYQNHSRPYVLVISHGDEDHCGAINEVVGEFSPPIIIFSPLKVFTFMLLSKVAKCIPKGLENRVLNLDSSMFKIFRADGPYKVFRVKSKLREHEDNNASDILGGFSDTLSDFRYPVFVDNKNPYLDFAIAIEKNVTDDLRSFLEDIFLPELLSEFETFDNGQNAINEKNISDLIHRLNRESVDGMYNFLIKAKDAGFLKIGYWGKKKEKRKIDLYLTKFKKDVLKRINNSMSLVIRVKSSLFTGDAELQQLSQVGTYFKLFGTPIDIIKAPHHGSKKNHCSKLYKDLNPSKVYISQHRRVNSRVTRQQLRLMGITVKTSRKRHDKNIIGQFTVFEDNFSNLRRITIPVRTPMLRPAHFYLQREFTGRMYKNKAFLEVETTRVVL